MSDFLDYYFAKIGMSLDDISDDYPHLAHIGRPHEGWTPHSGRYVYGTGKKWDNRHEAWIALAKEREAQLRDHPDQWVNRRGEPCSLQVAVAATFNMSSDEFRRYMSIHSKGLMGDRIRKCQALAEKGLTPSEIARETGFNRTSVDNWLKEGALYKADKMRYQADQLIELLKDRPYLDLSAGVERQLGLSDLQLERVRTILKDDGYEIHELKVPQTTNPDPSKKTTTLVLTEPGVTKKEVWDNIEKVTSPDGAWFEDYGSVIKTRKPPVSVDSRRIDICYAEEGGKRKDGVIEIRPGLEDVNLGDRPYAQVRIAVDGTHYLKGMAIYSNDLPDGIDIRFNTNKHEGTPMLGEGDETVLKHMKKDPLDKTKFDEHSPFGSNTTQWNYTGKDGLEHQSPVEIVNDDDSWDKWKSTMASQVLSKQPVELARRQLQKAYDRREDELKEIESIQNPTLKRMLLAEFADSCDSAAYEMKAAPFTRQTTNVIIPIDSLKDDEIYAPFYEQGEEVVLIRFPHQGRFEIPRLHVNNTNKEGLDILGNRPEHAVGINANVAERLSGADFDGDTVLVIPTKGVNIKNDPQLQELKDFDPKEQYKKRSDQIKTGPKKDGGDGFLKGHKMGDITNLLSDMTIMGASEDEIVRAVKHALVVIDAEKHNLDWKQSEKDNRIAELKVRYQGKSNAGGQTFVTRGRGEDTINERFELTGPTTTYINPYTHEKLVYKMTPEELELFNQGKKVYHETGRVYTNPKTGKETTATEKIKRMDRYDDAYDIISDRPLTLIEDTYAQHVNKLKRLGEKARAEARSTGTAVYSKEAAQAYKDEVQSLKDKLDTAKLNDPRERQANRIANKNVQIYIKANPALANKEDKDAQDKLKKIRHREIEAARAVTGAKRNPIELTPKEWEAIDAGALTDTKIMDVLRYTDKNRAKDLATGHARTGLSEAKVSRARQLLDQGWTWAQVASELGVSASTLRKSVGTYEEIGGD